MDKIIKFENLNKEFYQLPFIKEINKDRESKLKLGHKRKQMIVDRLKDLYDRDMIDVVSEVYEKEIQIFNFKF